MTMAYQLADMLRPAMWMIPVMEHKKMGSPILPWKTIEFSQLVCEC
jgi:hypothetical protein